MFVGVLIKFHFPLETRPSGLDECLSKALKSGKYHQQYFYKCKDNFLENDLFRLKIVEKQV